MFRYYLSFKYIKLTIILSILAILILLASIVLHFINSSYDYFAGVLSNISTGIITGVFICFITGTKSIQVNKLNETKHYFKDITRLCKEFSVNIKKSNAYTNKDMISIIKDNITIVETISFRLGISIYKDFGEEANLFQDDPYTNQLYQEMWDNSKGMLDCTLTRQDLPGLAQMKAIEDIDFIICIQSMKETELTLGKISQHAYEFMSNVEDKLEKISCSII